jgi:hypothetical protein
MRGAISLLPNTPLWRGAQLQKSTGITLTLCLRLLFNLFYVLCIHSVVYINKMLPFTVSVTVTDFH